jgi:hypothetical protein
MMDMSASNQIFGEPLAGGQAFATTHWSVVLAAGHDSSPSAHDALEKLCRTYWYPLYGFVRRRGHGPEDAKDLTHDFFVRFLSKKYFKMADPERGRFRAFLLTSLKHFLIHEWEKGQAAKRGGGQVMFPGRNKWPKPATSPSRLRVCHRKKCLIEDGRLPCLSERLIS